MKWSFEAKGFMESNNYYSLIIHIEGGTAMRTTLNIDDELLEKASKLTGIKEKNIPG